MLRLVLRAAFASALLLGAFGIVAGISAQEPQPSAPVMVLEFDGAVTPASADYITRALSDAAERDLPLVVLRMDTPGGLASSMRDIIRAILASPVPVASYVSPSGASAASAGTYIMYASHIAAMAPATNLGAATPVAIGGGGGGGGGWGEEDEGRNPMPFQLQRDLAPGPAPDLADETQENGAEPAEEGAPEADSGPREEFTPQTASEAKAINDAVAYIRGLAELRGRNADWAESAVRRAESLSSSEAAALDVIDFVARNLDDLLAQADGMVVTMFDGDEITLSTQGLSFEHVQPDWRTEVLSIITNPNVALILMLVGVYGLIFEFINPGALVPGTVGGISLLLGLYSLALLPLNWAGVGLILLGIGLIVAEAFAPSFGVLGIGGTVALVTGAVILVDTDVEGLAVSEPLIAATAIAGLLVTMVVVHLATGSYRARIVSGREELAGAEARVTDWRGESGHVWLHGERWKARGPRDLVRDDTVQVRKVTGLVLEVKPLERAADQARPT